jgi:hypothetical protein
MRTSMSAKREVFSPAMASRRSLISALFAKPPVLLHGRLIRALYGQNQPGFVDPFLTAPQLNAKNVVSITQVRKSLKRKYVSVISRRNQIDA